jgi:hypothetical protein
MVEPLPTSKKYFPSNSYVPAIVMILKPNTCIDYIV